MATKNPQLEPDELDLIKIQDNTVTIIIKNGGKIFQKGLTLPEIHQDTPDEDVHMAMQRVKDVGDIGINTLFYTLKKHGDKDVKPELA
jgi:hypothetical protein